MDTSFLNFHGVEHFSLDSYFSDSGVESHNLDDVSDHSTNTFTWEWENDHEKEINTEASLIPSTSTMTTEFCELPPTSTFKEDFSKMLSEWQQLIETSADDERDNIYEKLLIDTVDIIDEDNFDITTYINETEVVKQVKSIGPGGKKIDMEAQKYLTEDSEDDQIDVETISEHPSPVLEAGDVNSLLEQFEAETRYNPSPQCSKYNDDIIEVDSNSTNQNVKDISNNSIKKETVNESIAPQSKLENDRHKQIKEALPQELINRIKQCSKRKPISVIPAKPTKKRGRLSNVEDNIKQDCSKTEIIQTIKQEPKLENLCKTTIKVEEEQNVLKKRKSVHTDHDYCLPNCPYPKQPMKDSGFESAEEEEKYLLKQPIFKNAKTMVSILKSNNIRNSNTMQIIKQKRKLNLEEYKKRREFNFKNSASISPLSSGRTSPIIVEDENTKRIKHQELLMKMASEVLKAKIKEESKSVPTLTEISMNPEKRKEVQPQIQEIIKPPSNLEVKTLVSVATNTEESWCELKKIKPILENINVEIKPNSLIASVIENIPKIKTKQIVDKEDTNGEHGENKTIVYLDKNRPIVNTCNVHVQTDNFQNMNHEFRSRRSDRRRNSSSSDSMSSSTSSTSHSSRSRSPSPTPSRIKYKRRSSPDYERLREVEERRVVYVGGISSSMTREDLKLRFQCFGPISNVSVHFRTYGDNYGFVTFLHKLDAYEAVEHGNDDHMLPHYDLSFGGRRMFCKTTYADLDDVHDEMNYFSPKRKDDSFDALLREAQAKLRRRKF